MKARTIAAALAACLAAWTAGCVNLDGAAVETAAAIVHEDGSTEEVELVKAEAWLAEKNIEISALLEAQDYIDTAMVSLQGESESSPLRFYVILDGAGLDARVDEILSIIGGVQNLDTEGSYIMDAAGNCIFEG